MLKVQHKSIDDQFAVSLRVRYRVYVLDVLRLPGLGDPSIEDGRFRMLPGKR